MIIGTTKIEKGFDANNNFIYVSFIDLEEPGCEYREFPNGGKAWLEDGLYHRDGDEPAIIWADGSKFWYKNGKRHRDGNEPAIIFLYGRKEWWKNGEFIKSYK